MTTLTTILSLLLAAETVALVVLWRLWRDERSARQWAETHRIAWTDMFRRHCESTQQIPPNRYHR